MSEVKKFAHRMKPATAKKVTINPSTPTPTSKNGRKRKHKRAADGHEGDAGEEEEGEEDEPEVGTDPSEGPTEGEYCPVYGDEYYAEAYHTEYADSFAADAKKGKGKK